MGQKQLDDLDRAADLVYCVMDHYVVVYKAAKGFTYIGPFDSAAIAQDWIDERVAMHEWYLYDVEVMVKP
jgi:hypothetical protein